MSERLLLGILSLGLPDQSPVEDNGPPIQRDKILVSLQNPAKLHVGMLTISLIIGLAFGGYMGYNCWAEKNTFRIHVRNLVIAFVCRIFFSILFDGVIILGSSGTADGGNTLLAFECICQNLVIAFWLLLTVYLHARVQRKFNSEPTLTLYEYGIPGVALFFAFVWIFGMHSEYIFWWVTLSPLPQWIVTSLRLLYLLIQLGLVVDMGRMMMKTSLDNDTVSLLRKSAAIMAALILLFWLQFGFNLGRMSLRTSESCQYFDYFIDGSQGGLACLALFFFDLWVPTFLNKMPSIMTENGEVPKRTREVLLTGSRGVETIDKVFREKETGRWNTLSDADAAAEFRDVMYSTVVEPHRLKKTLDLYKRLNVLPNSQATVLDGEQFYDCKARHSIVSETGDSEKADFLSVISDDSRSLSRDNSKLKTRKLNEQVQKKNAFYASKYLILDSKEGDIPKFLESRPFEASDGKKSTRKEGSDRNFLDTIISDELVHKWLDDNSENLRGKGKSISEQSGQKPSEDSQPKLANVKESNEESVQNLGQQVDNQKSGSTVKASESTDTAPANALVLTETKTLPPPILRKQVQRANKRKLSETYERGLPNESELLESSSGKVNAEAEDSLGNIEPSEAHRESKRRKSTEDLDEYQPVPFPRGQKDIPMASGKVEEPPHGDVQSTESNAATATPTPMVVLPISETPPAAQFGGLSEVLYSTINSLLNLRDGLFKSRSSVSSEETVDVRVPSEREDDIHKDKIDDYKVDELERQSLKVPIKDSYPQADVQTLHSDLRPPNEEAKFKECENKSLQNIFLEEQSFKGFAQEKVEEQEKPPVVVEQMQKPQESLKPPTVSPNAGTFGDELSSESNFSIEEVDSRSSSFSLDNYYAELKVNREKIDQHPFVKNPK